MQSLRLVTFLVLLLSGCGLPRGAAVSSEILRDADSETADFMVVSIDKSSVDEISRWPAGVGEEQPKAWVRQQNLKTSTLVVGDHLNVTVWDMGEASLLVPSDQRFTVIPTIEIAPDGTVFIPFIGDIQVAGLTLSQARETIANALAKYSSSSLQVDLRYTAGENSSVDIIGGVARAGTYPLGVQGETTLSLLSKAGGVSPSLRHPKLTLARRGKTYEIWLDDLLASPKLDIPLAGGDQITIQKDSRFFQVLGATTREELVYFDRSDISARESLSMIGGLSETRANPKGLLILREYPKAAIGRGPTKERVIFSFDMTTADGLFSANRFKIAPGDLVLATEAPAPSAATALALISRSLTIVDQIR